jgi:hypothetical protein
LWTARPTFLPLRLLGIEALARYIVDEMLDAYRLQGVKINDKMRDLSKREAKEQMDAEEAKALAAQELQALDDANAAEAAEAATAGEGGEATAS